jgi:hypothetical protein
MCAGFGVWGLPIESCIPLLRSAGEGSFFVQAREEGAESCEFGSGEGGWNNILLRPLDDGVFLL